MASRPFGLERLSSKIRPKSRESYKIEEPADDLGVAGLHEGLVGDGAHAGVASRLCGNQSVSGGGRALIVCGASKKPNHFFEKRYLWRDASSGMVMSSRSG